MSKVYSIYEIQNKINNKRYIGFTRYQHPIQRFYRHIRISEDSTNHDFRIIHKAIAKYGRENFTFKILYQSLDQKHTLKEMEPYFIKHYDSFGPNGYNLTRGGEGILGHRHSEETRAKIKEKRAIQIFSPDCIEKLKQHGLKGSPAYNKRFTEETKSKLSESQSQRMKEGYNPKATKWIVRDNHNRIQEICNPTTHFGKSFKSFWVSHKKKAPIQKGAFKDWQLLEIIKI